MPNDLMIGRIIFFIILFIGCNFLVAKEMYSIAKAKGYDSFKYFLFPFFLTLAGWMIVLALPDKNLYNPDQGAKHPEQIS